MPAGINTEIGIHYGSFAIVKLVGYSMFAIHLNNSFGEKHNVWKVGATRMLIGMILGGPFGYYFNSTALFFPGLVALRMIEWSFIIWLFYDRNFQYKKKFGQCTFKGILVSFLLDIPALLGFMVTGGFWIC